MRLTLRGWAVVVILGLAIYLAWLHGPRALNAIAAPLTVILIAAIYTTIWTDAPTVTRHRVDPGFVGDVRTVRIDVDVSTPVAVSLDDRIDEGVSMTENSTLTTMGDDHIEYDVRLDDRGRHELGPLTLTVTDVFGLTVRRFTHDDRTPVYVYPEIYTLRTDVHGDIAAVTDAGRSFERMAFDHLREYERGDALRDVHWKSAAKQTDETLIVKQFRSDDHRRTVTVVGESSSDCDDEMATAVGSIVAHLLSSKIAVAVVLPGTSLHPASGWNHLHDVLGELAVVDSGSVSSSIIPEAEILVRATDDETTISFEDEVVQFDRIRGERRETIGSTPRIGDSIGMRPTGVIP